MRKINIEDTITSIIYHYGIEYVALEFDPSDLNNVESIWIMQPVRSISNFDQLMPILGRISNFYDFQKSLKQLLFRHGGAVSKIWVALQHDGVTWKADCVYVDIVNDRKARALSQITSCGLNVTEVIKDNIPFLMSIPSDYEKKPLVVRYGIYFRVPKQQRIEISVVAPASNFYEKKDKQKQKSLSIGFAGVVAGTHVAATWAKGFIAYFDTLQYLERCGILKIAKENYRQLSGYEYIPSCAKIETYKGYFRITKNYFAMTKCK